MLRSALAALVSAGASRMLITTRLLSTGVLASAGAPRVGLEEQLQQAPWVLLLQVPGAGRGLFAAADIEQGTVVYEEAPMLWTPHPAPAPPTTCHACLRPLAPSAGCEEARASGISDSTSSSDGDHSAGRQGSAPRLRFCSPGCRADAEATWAAAAADCDFWPLQQACREAGEKFPLMAAQLACMQVQRWQQQQQQQQDGTEQHGTAGGTSTVTSTGGAPAAAPAWQGEPPTRGDALTQLHHLCYANIAVPPEPWVRLHSLLLRGLQPLASSARWAGVCTAERLQLEFSPEWFCGVLARLHLNAFRVDTVPPLDLSDPSALLRAAAASLGGSGAAAAAFGAAVPGSSSGGSSSGSGAGSTAQHHPGSAAFLLASMLNHSCEPNLDISWPHNNAVARFTAARDIAAHEQLTISYIDAEQSAAQRQAALQFAYGFSCGCPRCREGA
ncbi:hypothetical protein ABPG75_005446 [Micractinium tetrahymenae]